MTSLLSPRSLSSILIVFGILFSAQTNAAWSFFKKRGPTRQERHEVVKFSGALYGAGYALAGTVVGGVLSDSLRHIGLAIGAYFAFNNIEKLAIKSRFLHTGWFRSWRVKTGREEAAKLAALIPLGISWLLHPFLGIIASGFIGQEVMPEIVSWAKS